jgi:uncharacterized protein (UPF0332 family)
LKSGNLRLWKGIRKNGSSECWASSLLVEAQILRSSGDYDAISPVSKEQVEESLQKANQFILVIEEYIKPPAI